MQSSRNPMVLHISKPLVKCWEFLKYLFPWKSTRNSHKIFVHLKAIAEIVPMPMYWINTEGTLLGANVSVLQALGLSSYREIVGKEIHDFHPKEVQITLLRTITR